MNPFDLNPNIEEAWAGRELKLCSNTVECCRELSRVWLALGDDAIKRPFLGSASERVKKLRTENASMRSAVQIIVKGFSNGIFVRSTAKDANPQWAVELLPYIQALQALTDRGGLHPNGERAGLEVKRENPEISAMCGPCSRGEACSDHL